MQTRPQKQQTRQSGLRKVECSVHTITTQVDCKWQTKVTHKGEATSDSGTSLCPSLANNLLNSVHIYKSDMPDAHVCLINFLFSNCFRLSSSNPPPLHAIKEILIDFQFSTAM